MLRHKPVCLNVIANHFRKHLQLQCVTKHTQARPLFDESANEQLVAIENSNAYSLVKTMHDTVESVTVPEL
jgi:hypothetical protein